MSAENINNVSNQKPVNEAELYAEAVQILSIESNKLDLYKRAKELLEQIPHYKNAQKLLSECDAKIESIRRQIAEKKAKKAKRIRAIIVTVVVIVVGILAVSAIASANSQEQKDYEAAIKLLDNAKKKDEETNGGRQAESAYSNAYNALNELGDYNGAGLLAIENYLERVRTCADNADYTKAYSLFEKASAHAVAAFATEEMLSETEDYIYQAIFKDAEARYTSGDYNNALDLYKMLDQDDEYVINKMDGCKFEGVSTSKVNSVVKYGSYEINGDPCDFEDSIEWIVLAKEGSNKYLLITKDVIDVRAYNAQAVTTTWAESDIRAWLNGEFAEIAFSELEASKIAKTNDDQVFLLSADEAAKYLTDSSKETVLTEYAQYKKAHLTKEDSVVCRGWWLRDTFGAYDASVVDSDGQVVMDGYQVNTGFIGVRPAIWVVID